MNEEEFGFETEAIRTQLERTQYLEHSVPLYLTSSLYLKMQKTCVRHLLKKIEIFSRYSNPNTNEFVEKVCKMEGQLLVLPLLLEWLPYIQRWLRY
jgi:O-succinylhomoserine sulfhydrylase